MKRSMVHAVLIGVVATPLWTAAAEVTVEVGHKRLEPAEVSIGVGDTVTFHNQDEMPGGHTIVADDGSFQSPALGAGDKWSHTFEAPGSTTYHIKEHPESKGTVTAK